MKENLSINNKVIHNRYNQYLIIIEKGNVDLTRKIVLPYLYPSMKYRLGIKEDTIFSSKFDYFNIINKI
jgi:hypothetical protein